MSIDPRTPAEIEAHISSPISKTIGYLTDFTAAPRTQSLDDLPRLHSVVARLKGFGLSEDEAFGNLVSLYGGSCNPPWPAGRLRDEVWAVYAGLGQALPPPAPIAAPTYQRDPSMPPLGYGEPGFNDPAVREVRAKTAAERSS